MDPATVLQQLLRPSRAASARVASSALETAAVALTSKDPTGAWLALSGPVALLCAALVPGGLLLHLIRGGPLWDAGVIAAAVGALAGSSTELYKIVTTFAGGRGV